MATPRVEGHSSMRSKSRSKFMTSTRAIPAERLGSRFLPAKRGPQASNPSGQRSSPPAGVTVRPGKLRDGRAKSIVPSSSGVTSADEIAMSEENDGVVGNLPRSRPGVRSDKRASSKRAGGAGAAAGAPPAPDAKPSNKPRTKAAAKAKAAPRPRKRVTEPPPPPPATRSPVESAIKAGEAVAVTSLKVAG